MTEMNASSRRARKYRHATINSKGENGRFFSISDAPFFAII
jgi:hypothetical protein